MTKHCQTCQCGLRRQQRRQARQALLAEHQRGLEQQRAIVAEQMRRLGLLTPAEIIRLLPD